MSIQVGLYDFFAYTLPGVLFVVSLAYGGSNFGFFQFDFQSLGSLSTPLVLFGLGVSYVAGMLLQPIAKKWHRILQPKGNTKTIFKDFEVLHPELTMKVRPEEAGLMRAYIKQKSLELALEIEKLGAVSQMLRNFCFDFAVLAVILLIHWLSSGFQWLLLVGSLLMAILTVVAAAEATKFDRWFHYLTLESIAAFSLTPTNHVSHKPISQISSPSLGKQQNQGQ